MATALHEPTTPSSCAWPDAAWAADLLGAAGLFGATAASASSSDPIVHASTGEAVVLGVSALALAASGMYGTERADRCHTSLRDRAVKP